MTADEDAPFRSASWPRRERAPFSACESQAKRECYAAIPYIVSAVISIATTAVSTVQAKKQGDAQTEYQQEVVKANNDQTSNQQEALRIQEDQKKEALARDANRTLMLSRAEQASAEVAASSAGVEGASVADRLKGQQAAMEAVSQARSNGSYNLAEETVSKLSAEFVAANKDASATTKEAFRKTVSETLRWDREGLREDSQIVQLEEQISDSVDPEQIGILADTAQSLMDAGRMSPSTFQAIQAKAKANTALLKEIGKTDVALADRSIFFYKDSESTIASVNLGSPQADEAWSKLAAQRYRKHHRPLRCLQGTQGVNWPREAGMLEPRSR